MLKAFADGRLLGASHGSPPARVVALHGWGRTHRDFDRVLDGVDAVALDLPGFGATPPPPEPWGAAEYAAAVAPVLDDADPAGVVLLCHSFGGRVGVHLAAARPDRVRALVFTGVPLVRLPGARRRRPPVPYRVGRWLHRRGVLPETRMEALRQRYGSADYRAAQGVMRAVHVRAVNETYEAELRALRCPVELVWGADDPDVPVTVAEAAAELLADVHVTVVPGAGHDVPRTAPEALRVALERRLA